MVLIAIWPVQKSENAVHLTGHKDSDKGNFTGKIASAGTGFEGSKYRGFTVPSGHKAYCMVLTKVKVFEK